MSTKNIPSPADTPRYTAVGLLAIVRRKGGRIYRMREAAVFVITDNEELAAWLLGLGGTAYRPINYEARKPDGSFLRARDGRLEWDIYVHHIPVKGERTIYEAAGRDEQILRAEDVA